MALLSTPTPVDSVLVRRHGLLEGPRLTPEGTALFSDVIAGGVFAVRADGEVAELAPCRRGVGGLVPHRDGGVVVTGRTLLHVDADGEGRELHADAAVRGFSDLTTTPTGAIVAGAPRYRPLAGEPPVPGQLVRVDGRGTVAVLSEAPLWPNGIGLSPDGSRLSSVTTRAARS